MGFRVSERLLSAGKALFPILIVGAEYNKSGGGGGRGMPHKIHRGYYYSRPATTEHFERPTEVTMIRVQCVPPLGYDVRILDRKRIFSHLKKNARMGMYAQVSTTTWHPRKAS